MCVITMKKETHLIVVIDVDLQNMNIHTFVLYCNFLLKVTNYFGQHI